MSAALLSACEASSGSPEFELPPPPTPDLGAIGVAAALACSNWIRIDQLGQNNPAVAADIQETCINILQNTADHGGGWPKTSSDSLVIAGSIVTQAGHGTNSYAGGQRTEDLSLQILNNAPAK